MEEWYQPGRVPNLIKLLLAVIRCNITFGWFASWHTFLPTLISRLAGHPTVLIVGGYDVSGIPDYGHQTHPTKKWVGRATMRLANRLIAFSNHSRQEAIDVAAQSPAKVITSYLTVTNVDYRRRDKEMLVVTAGNVNESNLSRKGHESFVRAAALAPHLRFVLIGEIQEAPAAQHLRAIAPANLELTGRVTDEELIDWFSRAKVYVQASLHEGFGLSVGEAMLCECVPVVTRAGSLPEVVGDAGVYIEAPDPEAIARGVEAALREQVTLGPTARTRIAREFPPERRARELYEIIDALA